jgi:TolB-like protein/Flp pilus assembly protein TadD
VPTDRAEQGALKATPIYRFNNREVVIRLRQVRADGAPIDAQPKTFDLLVYLIENRDRVVDRDELLERLWPGAIVTDSALTQIVRKARSVAGDDGDRQAVIRTIQRRGFRFVAVVKEWSNAWSSAQMAAAAEPSVAVLPFADLSAEHDQEHFCDGMVDEIVAELTRVPGLRVAARTSTFAFKHRTDDVRDIARRLGVNTVLEGSVRKAGERLRVTAQIIDAVTGFHLKSERWDRKLEDMLALQQEIAQRIAAALPYRTGPAAVGVTTDDLCDRGFAYLQRTSRRSQRFAVDLFGQVLALDPKSVRAWAGHALSYVVLYPTATSTQQYRADALQAATRALELGPHCAVAWTAFGAATAINDGFAAAERAFVRAIDLDPLLFETYHYFGHACFEAGEYQRAADLYERAAAVRPDDYQALMFARQAYRSLRRAAEELRAAERQVAAAERALRADPADARALSLSSGSLVVLGRVDEARDWTRRACALEPNEPYVHYNAAGVLARLGQVENALVELESGTENGRLCRPSWVEHDEDLASLRGHPRFQTLLANMRAEERGPHPER